MQSFNEMWSDCELKSGRKINQRAVNMGHLSIPSDGKVNELFETILTLIIEVAVNPNQTLWIVLFSSRSFKLCLNTPHTHAAVTVLPSVKLGLIPGFLI